MKQLFTCQWKNGLIKISRVFVAFWVLTKIIKKTLLLLAGWYETCLQKLVFPLWFFNKSTFKIKIHIWKWGFLIAENKNKFKKIFLKFLQFLQFLSSFKKYFFKLCLKVLRLLVHLTMSNVLFPNVWPIHDKAGWPVLVLWNGHLNFWKLPLNWKLFSIVTSKNQRIHSDS